MNITTKTKVPKFIDSLPTGKVFNTKRFLKNTEGLNFPYLDDKEIKKRYKKYLKRRYLLKIKYFGKTEIKSILP